MRKGYDEHEDHRNVGGTYLTSKPKRVPVITFVAQRERTADETADDLDYRVKGEEGGQQIKDLEVKRIKMGKKEERAGQRTSRRQGRIQSRGASSWSIGGAGNRQRT